MFALLHKIGFVIGSGLALLASLFGYRPFSTSIPTPTAFFQDSLASGITSAAVSMTLVTGNDQQNNPIYGFYGFVIDEGTANQEVVTGTASGTVITAMSRGLDPLQGFTPVTKLQFAHRRGASVKVTTSPWILVVHQILVGSSTLPNVIAYATSTATSTIGNNILNLANIGYVNGVASSGASDASGVTKGLVLIAPTATSTQSGVVYYVPPNQFFFTRAQSSSTGLFTSTTTVGGLSQIDPSFISTSSNYYWTGSSTFTGSGAGVQINASSSFGSGSTSTFNGTVVLNSTTTAGTNASFVGFPGFLLGIASTSVDCGTAIGTVSTSIMSVSIPAGGLSSTKTTGVKGSVRLTAVTTGGTTGRLDIAARYGGATFGNFTPSVNPCCSVDLGNINAQPAGWSGELKFELFSAGVNAAWGYLEALSGTNASSTGGSDVRQISYNQNTIATSTSGTANVDITVKWSVNNAAQTCTRQSYTVETVSF